MHALLIYKRCFDIATLLWLVLATNALAAAPEDDVVAVKHELLALANGVGPPPEKSPEAPAQPVQNIVGAGDWEFTLQFAARIGNEQSQANALIAILGKTRDLKDPQQGRAVLSRVAILASEIGNDTARARVLTECATGATRLDDDAQARALFARAVDIAGTISDPASKARVFAALAEVATALHGAGRGRALFDQARVAADGITDDAARGLVLTRLASAAAKLGDSTRGRELLILAVDAADAIDDDLARAAVLGAVAQGAANLGNPAQGRAVLENILGEVDSIGSGLGKARVLASVSTASAALGDPAQGGAVLASIVAAQAKINADFTQVRWLLVALVDAEVKLGNESQAHALTEQALRTADIVDTDFARIRVLESVAAAAAQLNDPGQGRVLLDRVLQETRKVADPSLRPRVLISVAQAAGKLHDPAPLEQAIAAADETRGEAERAALFLVLAETAAKLGDSGQARMFLARAAKETAGVSAEPARSHAQVGLAETALRIGDHAQAETSFEAVTETRERLGVKGITDSDWVRAIAIAASLDQHDRVITMAGLLSTDDTKLDALSRAFAVWRMQLASH